jgi:PAS domain-containing protein
VKLLTNPLLLRMIVLFFAAAFSFLLGMFLMKRLRRNLQEEASLAPGNRSPEAFPLETYHSVIQQLKQQKHELQALQQSERRRTQTTENISAAVLSNLSCGVLFFNSNGLVRQANPAAKKILGLAGPIGMNAGELFRGATTNSHSDQGASTLADIVQAALREATGVRKVQAVYRSPAGQEHLLSLTVSPVFGPAAELLGAACLLDDETEISNIRKSQAFRSEMPAAECSGPIRE